jgi:hypothetical protein
MYVEPLTPAVKIIDAHNMRVTVLDGIGRTVAAVPICINRQARTGDFGEMEILKADGGPRQKARALILLVRASLEYAESQGIAHVQTRAPERLRAFATRLTNFDPDDEGEARLYRGELAAIRSHTLDTTNPDGSER